MNLKNIVKNKISVEFCYFKKEGDKLKAIREDIAKVSSVTFFKSLDDSNENSVKIKCELEKMFVILEKMVKWRGCFV